MRTKYSPPSRMTRVHMILENNLEFRMYLKDLIQDRVEKFPVPVDFCDVLIQAH